MIALLAVIAIFLSAAPTQTCELLNNTPHHKGFALVIGNASYRTAPLRTTFSDACEVGKVLDSLGYEVDLRFNTTEPDLRTAVQTFAQMTAGKNLPVLFYFAGHGFQINGVNYLLPVDFQASYPSDIPNRTLSVDTVLASLKPIGAPKVIVLDACRANPLAQNTPTDWISGFAPPANAPPNSLIAFATDPGSIAGDGAGSHSPYTRAFLKFVAKPGLTVEDVFMKVRQDVEANTDGEQTPWENTSLVKPFYFHDPVYVVTRITDGDDDVIVLVNGREIAEWNVDGSTPRTTTLAEGTNNVVVKVYNQRSYTGGIPPFGHQPEGWRYALTISSPSGQPLVQLQDGEDRPADNGPRHGKLFTVATFDLLVDELTGDITFANMNSDYWKH